MRSRTRLRVRAAALACLVALTHASPALGAVPAAAPTLEGVIDSLRLWLVGLLAALATLFLTLGGVRYMIAGGDPGQIERAKGSLRAAAAGYALAVLAPVLVSILGSIVNG
jgi:hypothetical protein